MPDREPATPSFLAIAPTEQGLWHVLDYSQPGMVAPFDDINGVSVERAIEAPIYAIDTTANDDTTDGLYLVASGCVIDVDKLGMRLEQTHASGKRFDELSMPDLVSTGIAVPLIEQADFRLPPQTIGSRLTINHGKQKMSPTREGSRIRRIQEDLRPYGIHNGPDAVKFAARIGIKALGVEGDVTKGDLGGTPLTRIVRRLNYALMPLEEQEKMRRPLNRGEVIDGVRSLIASKLNDI